MKYPMTHQGVFRYFVCDHAADSPPLLRSLALVFRLARLGLGFGFASVLFCGRFWLCCLCLAVARVWLFVLPAFCVVLFLGRLVASRVSLYHHFPYDTLGSGLRSVRRT